MLVSLTIIRYRKRFIPFALLAMAIHRIPLWLKKDTGFYKLLGSGKDGGFSKRPDWQQWGILAVHTNEDGLIKNTNGRLLQLLYGSFIARWCAVFNCETWTVLLTPTSSRGQWDGKKVFGEPVLQPDPELPIAILTRATIRPGRLKQFWQHVEGVSRHLSTAKGLMVSIGIGEIPWIKQATFSIWETAADMQDFAYRLKEHTEVIRKTREEQWYSEELFARFSVAASSGTIRGIDPLTGGKPPLAGKS